MTFKKVTYDDVLDAQKRISPFTIRTPLIRSSLIDGWLGHKFVFKAEGFQKAGAFKARGAFNALLKLKEEGNLPKKVAAFSSGNHAQAVSLVSGMLGVDATIFMGKFSSAIKQQATRCYGATLDVQETRQEADAAAYELEKNGYYLLSPYDNDDVIAGQATSSLEAIQDGANPDAIFVPCSGGGFLSGTVVTARGQDKHIDVIGCEPVLGNDATRSYKEGKIISLPDIPKTLADGARTLSLSERTYHYVKQANDMQEVTEKGIVYWTQWLSHVLKISVEPTSSLSMAGAVQWLSKQTEPKTVLIMLSGGNVDQQSQNAIWKESFLEVTPDKWKTVCS